MTEKKAGEKNNASALPAHLHIKKPANVPSRTRGEKLFDLLTYWGVNYFLNYAISIGITDLFLGHQKKKEHANSDWEPTSYLAERLGGRVGKASDYLYGLYEKGRGVLGTTLLNILTLSMGGHITAVGVKLMENRRAMLSEKFDRWIDRLTGKTPASEELAERQTRYEALRQTPTKSLGRIFLSRFLALGIQMPVYAAIAKADNALFNKDHSVSEQDLGVKRLTRFLGDKLAQPILDRNPTMSEMGKKRTSYWGEIFVFEALGTALIAGLMEFFIKLKPKGSQQAVSEEQVIDTKAKMEDASGAQVKARENKDNQWVRRFSVPLPTECRVSATL